MNIQSEERQSSAEEGEVSEMRIVNLEMDMDNSYLQSKIISTRNMIYYGIAYIQ